MTTQNPASKTLAHWLFICCGMIFALVIVGAITRLTESGLSIVRWHAVMDMFPPLNGAAWEAQFTLYKATPEYSKINHGMSLDEFKNIYFWEWLHRLLARLVGLVYAVPLAYFWAQRKIPSAFKMRMIVFLALGGLQGFIGWYMVKSGLIDEPRVSHYRLAMHLGMALMLLALLWVTALRFFHDAPNIAIENRLRIHSVIAFALLCITILWGAFVAGLDAGMIYNEFPLMGGRVIPGDLFFKDPWWHNLIAEQTGVQFMHRMLGMLSFVMIFALGIKCIGTRHAVLKKIGITLCVLITLQVALGVATLLTLVAVPIAAAHQAGAVLNMLALATLLSVTRTK